MWVTSYSPQKTAPERLRAFPVCRFGGTAEGFEDRERGALRIRQRGHASDTFNRHGRHKELRAKIFGFSGARIAVGHLQINLPVGRCRRIAKRGRKNAANEFIVVEEMVVV